MIVKIGIEGIEKKAAFALGDEIVEAIKNGNQTTYYSRVGEELLLNTLLGVQLKDALRVILREK